MTEQKLLPSERRALKRREAASKAEAVFGTGKGSTEPSISALDYPSSLIKVLNHYNVAYDNKTKRRWTYAHIGKGKTESLDILGDWEFAAVGVLCRLKAREQPLQDKELKFIDSKIKELLFKASTMAPKEKPAPKVAKVDKSAEQASYHIGEIMGLVDEFILNDSEVDIAGYLKSNEVPAGVSKLIPAAFKANILELEEVMLGKDKDLVEGYSNFKKVKIRRLLNIYKSIEEACNQQVVRVKAPAKPRIKKEKPASVLVAKMKYLKEDTELGLKSESPVKIVGASALWVYNTKYKKLLVYVAEADQKLSVKGSSIIGYDTSKSMSKTIRKPEIVKDFCSMTKKSFEVAFKAIRAKESEANGRMNEHTVILKIV